MAAKIGGRRRTAPKGDNVTQLNAGVRGPGLTPGPGDNKTPAEIQREKDERSDSILVAFVSRIRKNKPTVEAARAAYQAVLKDHGDIYREAKIAGGFTRKKLDAYIDDLEAKTRDGAREEAIRARERRALGLATADQMDLFSKMPTEAQDQEHWRAEGYLACLRGEDPKPPSECPPRMVDHFMKGFHDGTAAIALGMKMIEDASTAPPPADPPAPDDDADADASEEPADDDAPGGPEDTPAPVDEPVG